MLLFVGGMNIYLLRTFCWLFFCIVGGEGKDYGWVFPIVLIIVYWKNFVETLVIVKL